ncbi:stage II sporulation protein D [Desulfohalotomaculum tongense]|uniref:stage II sporulation protein D n=1 Tax=Desulforadius tongensis TaxID=1216062 RepID=UPI00195895EA|nr:stage II sporulation protein D [Desulforadius tongensis]MBM7853727.1 stage II sporulation protein D [Desulforadius tongensis]
MRRKIPLFILGLILVTVALAGLAHRLPWLNTGGDVQINRRQVRLYHHASGKIEPLPLEEYLVGVVAAEMPASFPMEALKAQAVAARTYTAQRLVPGGIANRTIPGADVSDDHRQGQAWISKQEMKKRWGIQYPHYYLKIKWAVKSTQNKVLTYNNQLANAVYHASCGGGATENSGEVWQVSLPYLKSVPCPYCADPRPVRSVTYPLDKVSARLQVDLKAVPVSAGGKKEIIKVTQTTTTGRPKTLQVGGREMKATALRDLLNLRSTLFTYKIEGNKITFTTRGYGHGVGMCQYGAKGMAEHQKTYQQILAHYYPGTELKELKIEK